MLVLSHSDTHNLNGEIGWCGCHEMLIALCYPQEVFCPDQNKSQDNRFSYLHEKGNAQR